MTEVDIKDNALGDLDLLDNKYDRKFSKQQLKYWFDELKKIHSEMDDMLILRLLDAYSTHPHIVDELAEEHKQDPSKFPAKNEELKYPDLEEEQ